LRFSQLYVNGEDRTTELNEIARIIRLEEFVPGRYSALLLIQLATSYLSGGLNYHKVKNPFSSICAWTLTRADANIATSVRSSKLGEFGCSSRSSLSQISSETAVSSSK